MKKKLLTLFALHLMLAIYSISGVCSKLAAGEEFLSLNFCLFYGAVILLLGFYAIAWQQIIKRMPLTAAYANRAATVVWGLIWGVIFFQEGITAGKLIGAAMVIVGIVLYAYFSRGEKA